MNPSIGLSDPDRRAVVDILGALLADEYVLYTKTRNYHWNVVGMPFNDLHKFFEGQYEQLDDIVDDVAERSRALGGRSLGTLAEFKEKTRLKEEPGQVPAARDMLSACSPTTKRSSASSASTSRRARTSTTTRAPAISSPASWKRTRRWPGCSGRSWRAERRPRFSSTTAGAGFVTARSASSWPWIARNASISRRCTEPRSLPRSQSRSARAFLTASSCARARVGS